MRLLDKYRNNVLLKNAKAVRRTVRLCKPGLVKKIGILWIESDIKAFNYVLEHYRHEKIIVRNLCFTKEKKAISGNEISETQCNWLGIPKKEFFNDFAATNFDMIINLAVTPVFVLEYIAALSQASFKIGCDAAGLKIYDLIIDVSKKREAQYLAEQHLIYLEQLNKEVIV